MTPNDRNPVKRGWLSPLIYLSNNWLSLIGVVLVTTATIFWLFLLPTTLRGEASSPYIGILVFLILPAPFFGGLILIPLGIWLKRRREGRRSVYPEHFPPLNWHNRELRKLIYFFGAATILNIAIASQLAYSAVNYMDSVSFCGKTCHSVMEPEFTAYQNSPHARVECVKCHIGPGASWFVRSKLSGVGQVFAVTFNTYPRPIPVPVHNLRPARETCETCHWPQRFSQDRLRVIPKFAEDEQNTATKTVLLMKVGGGNNGIGIHGTHLGHGPGQVVVRYYASDEARQNIPYVEYTVNGKTTAFSSDPKFNPAGRTLREMDCMDCHNRPTHTYELPDVALNNAMSAGLISPSLPFARKTGLQILKANYSSRDAAAQKIPAAFAAFYRSTYPAVYAKQADEIEAGGQALLAIWSRNIFPDMNVTWGKYPNNIGHDAFPGCWRCHDSAHVAKSGDSITQDCNACHNILAQDESNPKILSDLGLVPASAAAATDHKK